MRGSGWHITIKVGNIYNGKIEVVSPVIESGKKFTTGVKFEVSVAKWNRGICCFFYLKSFSDILIESSKQNLNYQLTEQHQCTWKWDCKWLLKILEVYTVCVGCVLCMARALDKNILHGWKQKSSDLISEKIGTLIEIKVQVF